RSTLASGNSFRSERQRRLSPKYKRFTNSKRFELVRRPILSQLPSLRNRPCRSSHSLHSPAFTTRLRRGRRLPAVVRQPPDYSAAGARNEKCEVAVANVLAMLIVDRYPPDARGTIDVHREAACRSSRRRI